MYSQEQDYGCEITQDLTSYENAFENIVRNNPYRLKMLVKLPKQRSNNSARRTNEHNDESVLMGGAGATIVTMASLVPPFKKGVPGCLSMLIGIIYILTSVDIFPGSTLGLMRSTMLTRDIQKY